MFEMISSRLHNYNKEVLDPVIELAVEIGREGREGRRIGTLFMVGDAEFTQRAVGLREPGGDRLCEHLQQGTPPFPSVPICLAFWQFRSPIAALLWLFADRGSGEAHGEPACQAPARLNSGFTGW